MKVIYSFSLRVAVILLLVYPGLLWSAPVSTSEADSLRHVFRDIMPRKHTRGIFWKIEKPGLTPSYLMGTIHVDDPRVTRLPPVIRKAYDNARVVCTEVVMDFRMMEVEMRAMHFHDGRTLKKLLEPELYQATARLLKRYGLPPGSFDRMKPFSVAYLLNIPPRYMGVQVLDLRLYTDAIRKGKQICGLETADEHGKAFDFLTIDEQVKMLRMTVRHIDRIHRIFGKLLQAWLDRDLKRLVQIGIESSGTGDVAIAKKVVDILIIKRNHIMHRRMQPYLRKGNAFIAVGTMHLAGRLGLLRLLEGSGYKVTPLY